MSPFRGFRTLHFAVRPRVLARYLGQIVVALAAFTVVPAVAAWIGGRGDVALRYAAVIAVLGVAGGAGARLRATEHVQPNEALVVSALAFSISGLVMAYPLAGYGIAPVDAIFETISGVTTTGLSTLDTVEGRPWPFLFARAWLQWVGGLGIVVLVLAFMVPSGVAAKRLGFDEREAADTVGGTRAHARRLLTTYLCLTALAVALCAASGLGPFDALVHAMAAVSTGGFSSSDASLAGRGPWVQAAVSVACLAGAVPFALYHRGARSSPLAALRDSRLWMLLALTGFGATILAVSLATAAGRVDAPLLGQAAWMAVSAQTTAGFSTAPVGEMPASAKLVLIGGMIVGGEVGSTAGGLKILRLMILLQLVLVRVLRTSIPRTGRLALRIDGKRVGHSEVETAAAMALVYALLLGVFWLTFVAWGYDPLDSLFDVVSALSTVGLSAGTVTPALEPGLKGVLCVAMLMGRVELFAFLVLVFPGTWIGRRRAST